jgi:uncharacterized membrane protein
VRSLVLAFSLLVLTGPVRAQESGGSFGGSDWGDDDWGGSSGSSDWGSSGSSDWGASGSSDWGSSSPSTDWGASAPSGPSAAELEAERRAAEAAEAARRAEEERRRAEELRRLSLLSMPATERAHVLSFPPPPSLPALRAPLTGPSAPVQPRVVVARTYLEPPAEPPRTARFQVFDGPVAFFCSAIAFFLLLPMALVVSFARWPSFGGGAYRQAPAGLGPPSGLGRRVTLAFDWTERAGLQRELRQLAQRFAAKDRNALHASATEVVRLLASRSSAIRYASWELSTGDPRAWFGRKTTDLRARFVTERVRNQAGQLVRASGPEHTAREHEGEGLVVVSVLLAGRTPMPLPEVVRAEDVLRVLATLVPQASAMQALEVIWSPSEQNDRMSSLELEHHYPELVRLGEGLGRTLCLYCRSPLPGELPRCPSCGGPRRG